MLDLNPPERDRTILTPLDIRQQQFKPKLFNGLDPADVDLFLELAAGRLEELCRQVDGLQAELHHAQRELQEFRGREQELAEALRAATVLADQRLANAGREAELLIAAAQAEAAAVRRAADGEQADRQATLEALARQEAAARTALKTFFIGQLRQLDSA